MSLSEVLNAHRLSLAAWHSATQLHSRSVLLRHIILFPCIIKNLKVRAGKM